MPPGNKLNPIFMIPAAPFIRLSALQRFISAKSNITFARSFAVIYGSLGYPMPVTNPMATGLVSA